MKSDTAVANPTMAAREWGMLLALAVLWGGSFFFNGIAVRDLPSFTLVWLRVAVAAIALLLAMRVMGHSMPRAWRAWLAFAGMGLLNNVLPFVLIVWGQHRIASGLAAILNATTPLFTVLVAHLATNDERLSRLKATGVLIGFAGAAVMIGPAALGGLGTGVVAQMACLAAALSYAFASLFGRRFRRMGVAPMATATGQVTASAVLLLPIMLLVDHPWHLPIPHPATWGAVAGVGVLSTALAYVLYFRILAAAGATNLMLVTFLIPVTAILLGALVLGETLAGETRRRHGADRRGPRMHRRATATLAPDHGLRTAEAALGASSGKPPWRNCPAAVNRAETLAKY